jgi:hypothetical protein
MVPLECALRRAVLSQDIRRVLLANPYGRLTPPGLSDDWTKTEEMSADWTKTEEMSARDATPTFRMMFSV